jgi:hypothetical protein
MSPTRMSRLETTMRIVLKFTLYLNEFFHQSHHAYLDKE